MTKMLDRMKPLIVALRRKENVEATWAEFRGLVEERTREVCDGLSTRWLVSVCDTYVDLGTPVERRNAMLISLLVNMEKVAQSFLMWRVNYDNPFIVPAEHAPRKLRLWDGMTGMHMEIGDVTNNMFRRMRTLLQETPHLEAIFHEVLRRIAAHDTVLGAIDRYHNHVFATDLEWREAPRYDGYRASGELPPLKAGRF